MPLTLIRISIRVFCARDLRERGSRSTINEHILNIYKEGELSEADTVRKIGISDFSTKPTNFYNLDVVISVGYRVHSVQGTRFRQWATKRISLHRKDWNCSNN